MSAQTSAPRTASVVPHLIQKDLRIMRPLVLLWWIGGLAAAALTLLGGEKFFLFGMILYLTCLAGAGIHPVMQTVVEERREQTLPFIASLPITVRDYVAAKLAANLILFGLVWTTLGAAALLMFLGPESMQAGALPFVSIVLVGIFLAYTIVLTTSLATESIGASIASIVVSNIATQLFLWWVVGLPGIADTVQGDVTVWGTTALAVLGGQALAIVLLIAGVLAVCGRKADFA